MQVPWTHDEDDADPVTGTASAACEPGAPRGQGPTDGEGGSMGIFCGQRTPGETGLSALTSEPSLKLQTDSGPEMVAKGVLSMGEDMGLVGDRAAWVPPAPGVGVVAATGALVVEPVWESWLAPGTRYRRVHAFPRGRARAQGLLGVPSLSLRDWFHVPRVRDGGVSGETGIDMARRAHEVRKLFYAGGFTRTLIRDGIDPEDFLQEVYRGLLTRNDGTCPWDHKKSSFGHYVHIVMRCVLSNYLRKHRRTSSMELVTDDGEVKGGVGRQSEGGDVFHRADLLRDIFPKVEELALASRIVELMGDGMGRREVMTELNLAAPVVDGLLRRIRQGLQG